MPAGRRARAPRRIRQGASATGGHGNMPGAPARAHWSGGWRPGLHVLPCVCRRCRLRLTGGSGGGARRLCGRRQVAAGAREPLDLPRVQLHDPPGVRLFGAQPPLQVHPAARRLRPVGQHGAFVCLPLFRASVSFSRPTLCVQCSLVLCRLLLHVLGESRPTSRR